MTSAPLFRSLVLLALLGTAVVAAAKSDSAASATPVLFKREARFNQRFPADLTPDRPAVPVSPIIINYPEQWRQWGQPGYAVLEFVVKATGYPAEVQCTEATDRAFAKAAITGIENTFFMPALKRQQGVASKVVRRFEIVLDAPTLPPVPPKAPAPASPAP